MKFFADVKHHEIKGLVAVSRNLFKKHLQNLQCDIKQSHFLFNFAWYFIQLDIVH